MNNKYDYFDVFCQPGANPVFCYRTGLAVYEEALINGVFVSQGYNTAGYPLNVLTNFPTRLDPKAFGEPYAFDIEINGMCIDYDLKFVDFTTEKTDENMVAVITLDSNIVPVRVKVHTLLDGTQMFTRWLTIENLSDAPLNISRMGLLSGGLQVMKRGSLTYSNEIDKFYSLGYFDEDGAVREGDFAWHDLKPDKTGVETRFNRNRFRHPLMFIRNNIMGTMWFCQIGWSGGCRFTVDYNAQKEHDVSYLAFKAEITGVSPLIVLKGKETFTTPDVHMGVIQGDIDYAVNEMHDHIRKSVLNMPETDPSACVIGCGMGAEHDMSVETSKAYIDQFAEMGGELFLVDAGWECPPNEEVRWSQYNGINIANVDRYPNGLSEVSDYCHEKGLQFGMWVEIERVGKHSKVFEEHPEWRGKNVYGERAEDYLDFSNPEAAKWAEEELARIITEYKLDVLRVDYNPDHRKYFAMSDTEFGNKECISVRHFQAVYKMYTNLKKRFPNIAFENCASGGSRTDLGIMKAFNHTWVSDWQRMPRSIMITNGMTMALPPERVDRLFAGMGCHEFGSLDAHMRNTMLTHMSLNVVAPSATYANPKQMEFVKRSVQLYKDFIRPFLSGCRVFHPTPDVKESLDNGYSLLEIAAEDKSRGALGVFTLTGCNSIPVTTVLKGVDTAKTYKVTFDNTQMSFEMKGSELYMNGITIIVPSSLSSELVTYEVIG